MRDRAEVETAVVDAIVAGASACTDLPNDELLVVVDELAERRRRIDAALAAAAGEVAARSDGLPADEALVRRAGHRSVREMVQQRVGVRSREAAVLCTVADATRSRIALSGGDVPVRFPHVAAALSAGWVAVAQAHAIVETLETANGRVDVGDLDVAERSLVAHACGTSGDDVAPMVPEELGVLARRWLAHLDQDGAEPRHDEQLAQRFLRMTRLSDGSWDGRFRATAEQGDAIQTTFDALVRPRRVTFDGACGVDDEPCRGRGGAADADAASDAEPCGRCHDASHDDRTRPQRLMDAFAAIVATAAVDAPKVRDEAPTLTITVSEDALQGRATTVDDVPRLGRSGDPVPVSVAASLLCDAFVQVVVLGGDGEPLRQGRRERLFTRSQRRAIVARDRHCRAPGCTAPPGWCEAHHVEWWSRGGATDVDNGILLCRFHHVEVHRGTLTIEPRAASSPPVARRRGSARSEPARRWRVAAAHPSRARTRSPSRT